MAHPKGVTTASFYGRSKSNKRRKQETGDANESEGLGAGNTDKKTGGWLTWLERIKKQSQLRKASSTNSRSSLGKGPVLLTATPKIWKIFGRQAHAFAFASSCYTSVHVFAFEVAGGFQGQRRYLVTSYEEFWTRYKDMKPSERHFYEVIPEQAPCHLYFDLEYKVKDNPGCDGDAMVDILVQIVALQLRECYKISCGRENVLDLDSSSETKFSRHLIFHLPGVVFQTNSDVGVFVKSLELCRFKDSDTAALHKKMFVSNGKGGSVPFFDLGVYTKNRNFRLYLSSKLGKERYLRLSRHNRYRQRRSDNSLSNGKFFFLASLICNVCYSGGCKMLRGKPAPQAAPSNPRTQPQPSHKLNKANYSSKRKEQGTFSSPYPKVDQFILSVINNQSNPGGRRGEIRRCIFFREGKVIVYEVSGYRYCENIGRHHKSNGVLLVANLESGVYYQKCYDPDCKRIDFRSEERLIPEDLNPFQWLGHEDLSDKQLDQFLASHEDVFDAAEAWIEGDSSDFRSDEEDVAQATSEDPDVEDPDLDRILTQVPEDVLTSFDPT